LFEIRLRRDRSRGNILQEEALIEPGAWEGREIEGRVLLSGGPGLLVADESDDYVGYGTTV